MGTQMGCVPIHTNVSGRFASKEASCPWRNRRGRKRRRRCAAGAARHSSFKCGRVVSSPARRIAVNMAKLPELLGPAAVLRRDFFSLYQRSLLYTLLAQYCRRAARFGRLVMSSVISASDMSLQIAWRGFSHASDCANPPSLV